ncbi:MAG: outer membrane lipoprotein carrier protein LolA [Bacteroidetes bacterium]|nr:outer membrane lipoprotein carrier protein LolA [Bacteroidota bacterium]
MKLLLIIFCFSISLKQVYIAQSKSQTVLNSVSTKIKVLKSFYVEFSANAKNNKSGLNQNLTGKGWVKDQKFYASYGGNTIISNGIKTWTVVKDGKTVYIADANSNDDENMNPKKLMTLWESGFNNSYTNESTLNGKAVHVIALTPKNARATYKSISLYISKSSNDLSKAIMTSKDGTVTTYTVTKFTSNPTIEESKFVYDRKKYPGYKEVKE